MQDNRLNISQKMTGQGWAEMSKLLDLEMPVPEKGKRRFGWWWLALGLSIGLASGVFAVKYFTQTEEQPVDLGVPVAVVPGAANSIAAEENGMQASEDNSMVPLTAETAKKAAKGSDFSSKKPVTPPPSATQENAITQDVKSSSSITFEKNTLTVPSVEMQPVIEKSSNAEPQNPAVVRAAVAEKIAMVSVKPLPIPENPAPGVPSESKTARQGRWALYGSGMSSPDANSSGMAAGLMKSLALKKSRFSLEGGIGYAYMQQPLSVIFTSEEGSIAAATTFTDFNTVLGDTRIASGPNAYSNAAKLLKKLQLHYLEVPLAVSCRITPRFSLKGGVNAAILLNSSSDYTTGGIFSGGFNLSSLQKDEAEASFDFNGEQPSAKLNHFDLAAAAGFDYRISTRLAAGLGYQFGLLDLIPDNGAGDFNRLFRVTLRYNLTSGK